MVKLLGPARTAEQWRNSPGRAMLGPHAHLLPRITQKCDWLRGDEALSRLPFHIANQLADQTFATFDDLRVAFWKLVAKDPFVKGIYKTEERCKQGAARGLAPLAPESQQVVAIDRDVDPAIVIAQLPAAPDGTPGGVMYASDAKAEDLGSYVLHHIHPIHAGGGVYDLSNLLVVTPLVHGALLNGDYHYKQPAWLVKKIEAYYASKK
jgi:hypothetical protein